MSWKQKFQSRKLWAAIIGFVYAIVYVATGRELDPAAGDQIIEALPAVIALGYALVEGIVDAFGARANAQANVLAHQAALAEAHRQLSALAPDPNSNQQ